MIVPDWSLVCGLERPTALFPLFYLYGYITDRLVIIANIDHIVTLRDPLELQGIVLKEKGTNQATGLHQINLDSSASLLFRQRNDHREMVTDRTRIVSIMLASIYSQLAGGGAEASVPSSGT